MKTALFTNFTDQEFIGYWDGKGKKFTPGSSLYMPDYLARHFAKHLVNKELLRTDASGNLIHKDGEKMTSPKKPEDIPLFMELFNQAYTPDEAEELGSQKDDIDALIGAANKNRQERVATPTSPARQQVVIPDVEENPRKNIQSAEESAGSEKQDPTKPQVILPPDFGEDEDDEESFKGKPVETLPAN